MSGKYHPDIGENSVVFRSITLKQPQLHAEGTALLLVRMQLPAEILPCGQASKNYSCICCAAKFAVLLVRTQWHLKIPPCCCCRPQLCAENTALLWVRAVCRKYCPVVGQNYSCIHCTETFAVLLVRAQVGIEVSPCCSCVPQLRPGNAALLLVRAQLHIENIAFCLLRTTAACRKDYCVGESAVASNKVSCGEASVCSREKAGITKSEKWDCWIH